jgi:penicillin amidase
VPSLRYIAHLNGPGINVIGAGEPALPGISIGHNDEIAFGLTIFPIDQEDLYVYKKKRGGYEYKGDVEPFVEVQESVAVKNGKPQNISLKFTRHGPVVAETKKHAFVVRAAWLEPGMAPYFGSIEYMRAQNFREFVGALNRWGAPSENQVYADTEGNIGYKPAGRFPKRDNWDGLMPVPGDGRYEWDGYFDMDVLPEEYNPKRGFSGTANAMSLPGDYPIDQYKVGFEWSAPWRYKRLWEFWIRRNPTAWKIHWLCNATTIQCSRVGSWPSYQIWPRPTPTAVVRYWPLGTSVWTPTAPPRRCGMSGFTDTSVRP